MLALLIVVGSLLVLLRIMTSVLRYVRFDQAARVVEHWRRNGTY